MAYRDDEASGMTASGDPTTRHSESDDEDIPSHIRTSAELKDHDRTILQQEDEEERLLSGRSQAPSFNERIRAAKQAQKDARRLERQIHSHGSRARRNGAAATLYELEEGPRSRTPSSDGDSSPLNEKLQRSAARKSSKAKRLCRFTFIHVLIAALFAAVAWGAYRATRSTRTKAVTGPFLSNGTSSFAPTTILISLDGFRADFLNMGITPYLKAVMLNGVSPKYMTPSFPSVTFPNHFTLVTGLYPESHGIVSNQFWDPALQEEFYYTDKAHSMQPKWWLAEPVWETAEENGIITAIHMWPGSEAHIGNIDPYYLDKFNGSELLDLKVHRILELLDKPGPRDPSHSVANPRPQLIAAYVPNVDADGHLYGPNSTEVGHTVVQVDKMIGDIVDGLRHRNLTKVVNLVIVSDHGMATTSTNRLIQLEDLLDVGLIEHIDGWPNYGLRPKEDVDVDRLYSDLAERARDSPAFEVYLKDHNMPQRYHFSNSDRIAPLWIFPKTGWNIVTKDEYLVADMKANGDIYHPRGVHGYDHEDPLMRAIFLAQGPAFPHAPGSRLETFQNINVYNIICDSLGLAPLPNNGTLRLPLKPVGIHGDTSEKPEVVQDFPPADPNGKPIETSTSVASSPTASRVPDSTDGAAIARPTIDKGATDEEQSGKETLESFDDFVHWLKDKFHGLSDWATGGRKGDEDEA